MYFTRKNIEKMCTGKGYEGNEGKDINSVSPYKDSSNKILLLCLKTWNLLFCLLTKTKVFFSSFSITNKKQFDKSIYLCSLKIDSREHCFLHCQNYVTFCSTLMNELNSISSFLVTLKYNSFWR